MTLTAAMQTQTHTTEVTLTCHWMHCTKLSGSRSVVSQTRFVTIIPCSGASPGPARSGTALNTGLNVNTVLCNQQNGGDATSPVGYWHGSSFTRMHRDGTKRGHFKRATQAEFWDNDAAACHYCMDHILKVHLLNTRSLQSPTLQVLQGIMRGHKNPAAAPAPCHSQPGSQKTEVNNWRHCTLWSLAHPVPGFWQFSRLLITQPCVILDKWIGIPAAA